MKKLLIALLALSLLVTAVGCNNKSAQKEDDDTDSNTVSAEFDNADTTIEEGDVIPFGAIDQDADPDNGAEPIEWYVLRKDSDQLLLLSVKALTSATYDQAKTWINGEFLSTAFTQEEQQRILQTSDTGRVFLLGLDEARSLMDDKDARFVCAATKSTIASGYNANALDDSCTYWLDGGFSADSSMIGFGSQDVENGVRPMIRITTGDIPSTPDNSKDSSDTVTDDLKAKQDETKTFFFSESNIPELSDRGVKGLLKEVYFTTDGTLAVTLNLSNGTPKEMELLSIGIRIFNDKNETVAEDNVISSEFFGDRVIAANGYGELSFEIDKAHIAKTDDSLKALGTTLEISCAPTDGSIYEAPKANEFFNDENNFYDQNAVSIRPRYLYWKDGELVAECFVINGYDMPVSNINVKELSFTNNNGTFANADFGMLDGLTLEPYTHAVWTFTFGSDCIAEYDADLSSITYNSKTEFNY